LEIGALLLEVTFMSDYYAVFGKEKGTLVEQKGKRYFHGKTLGYIEIKCDDMVDFSRDGEWVPHQYNGDSFVKDQSVIQFSIGDEVRYHRSIDPFLKERLDQILHPESFRKLISKLYSIQQLTLFDCILFRHSGDWFEEGNHFFFFENSDAYCSVHHYYKRIENEDIPGGYSYVFDQFEFITMDGQRFTETYEKKNESNDDETVREMKNEAWGGADE